MDQKALIRRIMNCAYQIEGVYTLISKAYGTRSNEMTLFYALGDGKVHTQKQICEEWYIPKTTLNTIIKDCESEGYLTLESTGKGRELAICLTEKGKAYAGEFLKPVYELEAQALKTAEEKFGLEFIDALECYSEAFEGGIQEKKSER